MGRTPTGHRKYQIQSIWDQHHSILQRLLLGQRSKDIAAELGCTEAMVSYTKNSTLVQRQLSIMRGARDAEILDCAIQLKQRVGKALEVLDDTLENENFPALRYKAASDILDREVPKVSRFEGITARLSREDISRLTNRAITVAREAGLVVEQQPERLREAGLREASGLRVASASESMLATAAPCD